MTATTPRTEAAIDALDVSLYRIPTDGRPESDGTAVWDATTMVLTQPCADGLSIANDDFGTGYNTALPTSLDLTAIGEGIETAGHELRGLDYAKPVPLHDLLHPS